MRISKAATIQTSGSNCSAHLGSYSEDMERQSSNTLESTNLWDIQVDESSTYKSKMYGQQNKIDDYIQSFDVDPLLKVEAIITESQDDNIIEGSSNIRKVYNRSENNSLHHVLVKEELNNSALTESKEHVLADYFPGNISLKFSQEKFTNIERDISKDNIENKSDISVEKKKIDDLKNRILCKDNYVDCPYENCIMKIFVDHIEKHLQDHEYNAFSTKNNSDRCFLCVECGSKYKVFRSITEHIFNHFSQKIYKISERGLNNQEAIRNCIQTVSDSESEIDIVFDRSHPDYRLNNSVIKNKNFEKISVQCIYNTCGKICKDRDNYDIHLKQHHTEIACEYCERLFRGSISLNKHIKHSHRTNFTCRFCGENFQNIYDRTIHIRSLHKEYKPERKEIICDVCGKVMSCKSALDYHMKLHTSTEVHYCDKCDFHSHTQLNVLKHWQWMHSNLKPVKCQICDKEFKNNHTRRNHVRNYHSDTSVAKPFECPNCDKAFRQSNHLKRHMLLHSGEKPFGCTLCDYRTNQRSNITVHMKSHRQ